MEHSEATESMASARYLLGEMTDEEKNAFEEHFFGCGMCAQEIRDGSAMIDTIRAEGRAAGRRTPARAPWLLAVAAAVVVAFLGYQNAMLRREASPHVLRSFSLLTMGTRGANAPTIDDATRPFALYLDIPPKPPSPEYRIEIRDAAGRTRVAVPVSVADARETVTIYVPGHKLEPGTYSVVVVGVQQPPITISSAPINVR